MLSKTYTKYIQSLHQKKFRDIENAFIAEGSKVVMDLLKTPKIVCDHILGTADWIHENEAVIRKYFAGPLEVVQAFELEKISALSTPNQVLAVFKKMQAVPILTRSNIILALDTIQDPGNLGTIIRIADWFGVAGIACSNNCADRYNPKVVQATMGSLGRVPLLYTDLADWLQKNNQSRIFAAALEGKKMDGLKGLPEGILIIGNESKGISEDILALANERVTIPRIGHAESLNAAVATGIILSHMR